MNRLAIALTFLGALSLATTPVFAGAEHLVRDRAKEAVNQNNVRQGVPPPGQPPSTRPATVQPAQPTPAQLQIAKLQASLAAIKTEATVAQKQQLATNLTAAINGSKKPSAASVTRLSQTLADAIATSTLTPAHQARLAQSIYAALNSPAAQTAQLQSLCDDVQAVLQTGGQTRPKAVGVANDLRSVALQLRQ